MDVSEIAVKEKWIVVPVFAVPFGISEINYKLPSHIVKITGVAFTLSEYEGVFSQPRVGDVSLQCNNKQTHPLNFDVPYYSRVQRLDTITLNLKEHIVSGTRISGYYRNLSDIEHTLKIYVHTLAYK